MQLIPGHIYHIFNRGNNSRNIFFSRENYLFFLQKINTYLLPHADILAWCLMPNHFHLMAYVIDQMTQSHLINKGSDRMTTSHPINKGIHPIANAIAIILRSYTRALQKQQNFTGSLFQQRTKAYCLTDNSITSPAWFQTQYGTSVNITDAARQYPAVCLKYIHENPVKAGLVEHAGDWEFSSYRDYFCGKNGKLVNRKRAEEYLVN